MTRGELKAIIRECIEEVETDQVQISESAQYAAEFGYSEEEIMQESFVTDRMNEACEQVLTEAEGEEGSNNEAQKKGILNAIKSALSGIISKLSQAIGRIKGIGSRSKDESTKEKCKKKENIFIKLLEKFKGLKKKADAGENINVEETKDAIESAESNIDSSMSQLVQVASQ